jgi:Na+/phosphate symporter
MYLDILIIVALGVALIVASKKVTRIALGNLVLSTGLAMFGLAAMHALFLFLKD